jgi:hypothetical protein
MAAQLVSGNPAIDYHPLKSGHSDRGDIRRMVDSGDKKA